MKSFSNWKGFSSNPNPLDVSESAIPLSFGKDQRTSVTQLCDASSQNIPILNAALTDDVHHTESMAMGLKVNTIAIQNHEMTTLNAAVLCSFAVVDCAANFLVYTLNEDVGDKDVRVYIATLSCANGLFSFDTSAPRYSWEPALRQIIHQVTGVLDPCAGAFFVPTYNLIDVSPHLLPTARLEQHATLDISRAIVTRLISWEGSTLGQPIECSQQEAQPLAPKSSTTPRQAEALATHQAQPADARDTDTVAECTETLIDDAALLDDVEHTLKEINEMACGLERSTQASTRQRQQQELLQNQLAEKENLLNEQARQLTWDRGALHVEQQRVEALGESLKVQQTALDELAARLQNREEALTKRLNQLHQSRVKFSAIIKSFQARAKLKNEQLRKTSQMSVHLD